MNAVVRSDWVGQIVDGRFPLRDWLGGSASSGVFLTEMPGNPEQKAAIKLIPMKAIDMEASILGRVRSDAILHPHLMRMLQTGRCTLNGIAFLYIVMDVADEVLSSVLPDRPLTAGETKEMLAPVLDALEHLHRNGLVHTRLKPSNIFVVQDRIQISTDGLCIAGSLGRASVPYSMYDAPEIGSLPLSPATDMWSLGITIVEALSKHPLDWNRATEKVPKVPSTVPEPFASIARACLLPQPSQRCSLGDVRAMLTGSAKAVSGRKSGRAARNGSKPGVSGPRGYQRTAILSAAAVALALLVAMELRQHRPAPSASSSDATQAAIENPVQPESAAEPLAKRRPESRESTPAIPADATTPASGHEMPQQDDIVQRVLPHVLPSAQATIQGEVKVMVGVQVDPSGKVARADLISPGSSRYFARISAEAAQKWRFVPAEASDTSQPRFWDLHFVYRRSGVEVTPVAAAR